MKARGLLLVLPLLCGCARSQRPVLQEDTSIAFPHFFEREAIAVGTQAGPFELDGETLRALMIAANDFLPPGGKNRACGDKQEAHRYRVIRQGNIVFVRIDEDPAYCGHVGPALDSGAQYAISSDGRILRRLFDGEPAAPSAPESPDAGARGTPGEPGVSPTYDAHQSGPSPFLPQQWQDAGTAPVPSSVPDGGPPDTP